MYITAGLGNADSTVNSFDDMPVQLLSNFCF